MQAQIDYDRKIKLGAIILSLLLNSGALVYFLVVQKMQSYAHIPSNPTEASIILQDPLAVKPPLPAVQPQEEWAQTYASQSEFGLPPDTQEIDETVQVDTDQETLPETSSHQEKVMETDTTKEGAAPLTTSVAALTTPAINKPATKKRSISLPTTRKQPSHAPKKLTVADLAKGFLDHMHENGQHSITMMGKKGALPTAQQLQNERYLQKLNWALHNTFRMNRDKMPKIEPQLLKSRILLELNTDGSLRTLQLIETCGIRLIDRFALFLFKEASSSFPPVPDFLPHDPYRITYTIEIGTDGSLPLGLFR